MFGLFTGFNPEQAQRDIENFKTTMDDYAFQLKSAGLDFFTDLRTYWCSGRAVDFSNKYSFSLYNATVYEIQSTTDIIYGNMIIAYNNFAEANNCPKINQGTFYVTPTTNEDFGTLNDMNSSGVVGMDKNAVKKALDEYIGVLKRVCSNIENYNFGLAFYDAEGRLQQAKQILKNDVNKILDKIEPIVNDITVYTQYETDRVDLAVNQATQQLSA